MEGTLDQVTAIFGRLEKLIIDHQRQLQASQEALHAAREREEAQFKQAMVAMFHEHQQRMEAALRPAIVRAWQIVAAVAGVLVLLLAGGMLLLKQTNDRLNAAQARADAAEVKAEVMEASRHVEITSCGGRPCIRLDKDASTWKSKGSEYILVDGK
ncbi:hypothetical protein FKV23_09800 [Lysobacter alkalisoli]|uniref:Uncharacterized protein n=2 Tax=Marilutibacter alkalisoli TaxID=2591633 RepID=A0A514BWN2_9GAMM|nr:hypothetical protein FKV23_09800 [Lysobacter alkalisoli]